MAGVTNLVVDLIAASAPAADANAMGMAFFEALAPFGAKAINIRGYQSTKELTESGLIFVRSAPDSFMPVYEEPRFYSGNPLPFETQRRARPFSWSELPWDQPRWKWVWNVMQDCGCPDGICVPCHGPNGYFGAVSLAFERLADLAPADLSAITLAGYFLHERMKEMTRLDGPPLPRLSQRECDCLSFVAEGMIDAEIAKALNVSVPTVVFHIANARRKLGAKTRAQAVAQFVSPAFK